MKTYLDSPTNAAFAAGDADFVDLILNNRGRHRGNQIPKDPAMAIAYAEGMIAAVKRFQTRSKVEAKTGMSYMEALLAGKA